MRNRRPFTLIAITLILLTTTAFIPGRLTASSGTPTDRLGFWLQEGNVMAQYSAQSFFNAMFLTSPYPSSVEIMIFAVNQAESNGQPCTSASSYISQSESYWGEVAQLANSYPNIQLVYEIAFDPSSTTYGVNCFSTVAQAFAQYPSVYAIGVEGEYTRPQSDLTPAMMQSAMNTVTGMGKQFISYYLPSSIIPAGGYLIYHTNFPGGDSGGYDQVGSLSIVTSNTVGLDSGYYANFNFPGTVTCPIGAYAMNAETAGWNQCVEQTELSTAVAQPAGARQFLELDGGFDASGSFTGVSGQTTTQMWDNPTLRNWIWMDPNYSPNFILSTSSSSTTTTTTSTSASSSTSSSTTSTSSSTSPTTSSTTTTTSSTRTSSTSTTSSTSGPATLSVFVQCPGGTTSCGTASPAGKTSYDSGTQVLLTATPSAGYQFSSWEVCGRTCRSSFINPYSLTIQVSGNATADFIASSTSTTSSTSTSSSSSSSSSTSSTSSTSATSSSSSTSTSVSSFVSTTTVLVSNTQTGSSQQSYPLSITGGCPFTGEGVYAAGSTAIVTFPGTCDRSGASGTRVASWSIDGESVVPVATNGTVTLAVPMDGPHVLTLNTVAQYALTLDYGAQVSMLSVTQPTLPGDHYWYDAGTAVYFVGAVKLQNSTAVSYALDGASPVPIGGVSDYTVYLLMNEAQALHVLLGPATESCPGGCTSGTSYDVTIQTNTNQPSGVWVDGAYYPKPVTFAWEAGSVHNITAAQGARETSVRTSFTQWSGISDALSPTITLKANETGQIIADYSKQYLVHFSFTDASGQPISPQSVALAGPSGTQRLGTNLSAWVFPGTTYTLKSATWMNWNVLLANDTSFSINQPTTLSFATSVYTETVKVTDAYGMPVQGASVNVTTLNGQTFSLLTGSEGTAQFRVPAGLFSATISYLGVNDQIVSSTGGNHSYAVSVLLSYPLIATFGVAAAAVAGTFAYFRLRKKPRTGVYAFSDAQVSD